MVLIIYNEIVADNDPRAIARRKGPSSSPPQQQRPPPGSNVRVGGVNAPPGGGGGGGGGGGPGQTGTPLDNLAAAIGIEGQVVTIPRLHERIPPRDVPMVVAGLIGVATLFMGWRVLLAAAAMHVIAGFSETGAAAGPAARPAGGAVGGRPR